jgi:hypothetical protein
VTRGTRPKKPSSRGFAREARGARGVRGVWGFWGFWGLKTENRILFFFIFFIFYFLFFIFRDRADALVSVRTRVRLLGRIVESARMHSCPRGRECVRADAPCFTPGNFKKDATVRPSHGRPCRHRLIVRSSVRLKMSARQP